MQWSIATWSIKRCSKLRAGWKKDMLANFFAEQLLFIDETRRDGKSVRRRYGRCPKGCTPLALSLPRRHSAHSILAMCSSAGVLEHFTVEGGFGADLFLAAFEELFARHIQPFPAPNSVLVLDNCAIHHTHYDALAALVEGRGGILIFLPPYSPDFSPIEFMFGQFKKWLKRHIKEWDGLSFNVHTFIRRGFEESTSQLQARHFYEKWGWQFEF